MHPGTWKQSNMLEVNHLCKVQGNEESKKQIFPFVDEGHLFCVVMSTVLCIYGDLPHYGTMPYFGLTM